MPSFVPPKRATALTFWVALISQASRPQFQSTPTLVAGDVQVSKDGGALANLAILPVVTPASSKLVKVNLSLTEMTADNIKVLFSDAAGAEWDDLLIPIQTAVRQIDDLSFPATSGRSTQVEPDGMVHADLKEWLGVAPSALSSGNVPADLKLWLTLAPDALSSGKVAADLKLWLATAPLALVTQLVRTQLDQYITGQNPADHVLTTPANKLTTETDGMAHADLKEILGNAEAVQDFEASAKTIVRGTVDIAGFTPTATQFEADDITEATADHFNGRIIIWTSGLLKDQATDITDYSFVGGRGHFTVTAMTEAPADNDTFVIV